MFCGQCGKSKDVDTFYCMNCGNRFPAPSPFLDPDKSIALPSTLTFAGATAENINVPLNRLSPTDTSQRNLFKSGNVKLQGVHGWLKLFCVSFCILGPLFAFARLENDDPTSLTTITFLALAAYQIAVVTSVWRVSGNALRYLRFFFIFQLALAGLEVCGGLLLGQDPQSAHDGIDLLKDAAKSIFSILVWGTYFRNSLRVRNTFGRNL